MKPGKRLSLHPLKFEEVIGDVLKVKPEANPKKKDQGTKEKTVKEES